jgi:hypothetical protein
MRNWIGLPGLGLVLLGTLGSAATAATCYGNADCRACKSCRYCAHCAKRGGTCGVCKRAHMVTSRHPRHEAIRMAAGKLQGAKMRKGGTE